MKDTQYMEIALELAKKGCGFVAPNPMVGAVIVKNGEIIGQGYHEKYGELHAERNAIKSCNESLFGATIYVTLEPCCHYGKTPPCTDAIIKSGIKKVVVGSCDPNPLVCGKGIKILKDNGIEVIQGVLKDRCDKLNEIFFNYIKTKNPFVMMKYAMTMDGKIATYSGKSKWITCDASRKKVHEDRHKYSAIMVGVGTVIADNPMLSCRLPNSKNPIRIICDTNLKTPLSSNVVCTAMEIKTIIATSCIDNQKQAEYKKFGCEIIVVSKKNSHIDLNELMTKLGEKKIDSIILEGGANLNWSAMQSEIVNKIQAYVATKIFGGEFAKSPVGGIGVDEPKNSFKLINKTITTVGDDILIECEVEKKCLQE